MDSEKGDWDYKEWPYQLRIRAKTKAELLERAEYLLECIKTGKADIVVAFGATGTLKMKTEQKTKK